DPREVVRRAGRSNWGLTSMRERAELIGGRLTVSSRPGHGTEVSVTLPLV
ncbi:MAG TPA: ATP-binding protein, partial [Roseiflexaceae bacterium]|nr:ATP-binding protein [Roseiflexaceae bacterium]